MLNHQRSLDAISNNLTNINTAGYKKGILFEASARALKAAGVGDKLPDLADVYKRQGWQAVFNTFGALAIAAET